MTPRFVKRWLRKHLTPQARWKPSFFRPFIEVLEERILLSTLIVNNPTDAAVANKLSLRQAVATANADAAKGIADTITFDPSLGSKTIKLTQGPLELSGIGAPITIDGSAPSTPLTLDGSQNSGRLFLVDKGVQAVIQNLNLQNDRLFGSSDGGAFLNLGTLSLLNVNLKDNSASSGGAIENQGTLTLTNAVLTNNNANGSSGLGGALDNTGTATVLDSTFSNDTATSGGAISNTGTLTVTNTTFDSNSVYASGGSGGAIASSSGSVTVTGGFFTNNSASGSGGAIANQGVLNLNGSTLSGNNANQGGGIDNSGTLTVTDATLSGNTAYHSGGGIGNAGGTVLVLDTTLSGNRAYQNGGGIDNASGTVTLTNSTLTGNVAYRTGGGIDNASGTLTLNSATVSGNTASSAGGGIDNNGGTFVLQNTILVGNTSDGSGADFAGSITTDNGYNLLGAGVGGSASDPNPGPHDVFNNNPKLAALGNYGGPTQTMAVLLGSPAIGAGNAAAANLPGTDQRGKPRTVKDGLDIGAFQTQPPAVVFTTQGQTTNAGQPTGAITVQLQDQDGNPAPAGSVSYSANGTTADASGTSNLTLAGGAGFAPGQTGQALSLNGSKQYAITPNLANLFPNGDTNVTVSLSFNAAAAGVILDELGQTSLNTGWHDSQIEILSDGTVKVRVWNLPAVTLGKASFNAWHTVVLRYNAATQTLDGFLDGVQSSTSSSGGRQAPYGSGGGLYYAFGATDGTNLGSGAYFKGLIQNITIFNRALSNAEVQALGSGSGVTTLTLSSTSAGGSFSYPKGVPITGGQIVVPPGASSVTVDYTDTRAGTPTLTVSAPGFATATQQETILPAPVSNTPVTDIVVGRTLSSYTTGGIQNGKETITYTVYNEQANPLTGVLLTDTLEPGVTFVSASQLPDQASRGASAPGALAWSLGTIQGFDRASVTLTVSLPATIPLQLDTGAQAFATLDGGSVSNATAAATLRQGSVDASLLASTPDANTTDPFIQEEAAALSYNAQNIFNFLQQNIAYNSYTGSLRGARGTLWSDAGNALDVASLGVALMRASGIPAQYVEGTLSQSQAQQLILSMFPASFQTTGVIPTGTTTADPAHDSTLLSETESHYWFEFNTGSGWVNADPLMGGTQVGQTFTAATGSFTEVAQSLRQTTEVVLTAEIYSTATAALGLGASPLQDTNVLDQTFNDVDLVGRPLTVGNLVSSNSLGFIFTATTNTYTPYILIGDDALNDNQLQEAILGQPYQEVLTNFPLGSQVLTGLFLKVTLAGAGTASTTYSDTLVDRIGYAARQGLAAPENLAVSPSDPPAITPIDLTTLNVLPGLQDPGAADLEQERANQAFMNIAAQENPADEQVAQAFTDLARAELAYFALASDQETAYLASGYLTAAYFATPRVTAFFSQLAITAGESTLKMGFNLMHDSIRTVGSPGTPIEAQSALAAARGVFDSVLESQALPTEPGVQSLSSITIIEQATQQGIPFALITASSLSVLQTLKLSPDALARITAEVQAGFEVVVPTQSVVVNGTAASAWYDINPTTFETITESENGAYQGIEEYTAVELIKHILVHVALHASVDIGAHAAANLDKLAEQFNRGFDNINHDSRYFKRNSPKLTPKGKKVLRHLVKQIQQQKYDLQHRYGSDIAKEFKDKLDPDLSKLVGSDPPFNSAFSGVFPPIFTPDNVASVERTEEPNQTTGRFGVSAEPNVLTTNQNTSVTFQANINTSLADTYTLTAQAPIGWTVTIDNKGDVTATPAPGLQGGTYPIQIIAQSATNPDLVAQTIVNVAITPTSAGITLAVNPDSILTVPFNGAQVPTAFQAVIHNTGPTADTYNLTFSNVPSGFTLLNSGTSVTIPAGQTGIVGIYLQPNGSTLPAPGTQLSFTVTATSTTNSAITQTQNVSFTMPQVDAVTLTDDPTTVNTTPGTPVSTTLTLTNAGNVPENVSLAATLPSGLTADTLTPVSLAVGQSTTETVTLTPDASTPLNTLLQATLTATFGPAATPATQTLTVPVDVVAPGVTAIANAAVSAGKIGNTTLANRLSDLSTALTNLVQHPTSAVYQSQVQASLTTVEGLLGADPFLNVLVPALTADGTAIAQASTASAVQAAVVQLGKDLANLAQYLADEAASGFTLGLSPGVAIVQPGAPEVFDILLTNKGTAATTYDLSVSGLPAGATAAFSKSSVTLQPGKSIGPGNNAVTLTLTESGSTLVPASFTVNAVAEGAPEITLGTPGQLTLRTESILVAGVTPKPAFTNAGGKVDVSAQVQAVVNEPTQVMASYIVTAGSGKVLFTSTPVAVALTDTTTLTTPDLGTLDTTNFANGTDTITVTLTDASGKPIAGASATGTLVIGSPVTGSITTTPTSVPTGTPTVTTTVQVNTATTYPAPLTLEGSLSTPAPGTSVALYQSGGKTYAYESGTGGMDAIDVTDPTNPQLLETFGKGDLVNGQFGFNVVKVVNGYLMVATEVTVNGSGFNLLVYSLANPAAPTLVSNTAIHYHYLSDMLVNSTGTDVYVPTDGVNYFPTGNGTGDIFNLFGDVVSIDTSDPTKPALAESLFTNQGGAQGGNMSEYGGTLVNDNLAYITGLSPGGGNVTGNTGNLLVVDVSDPKKMSVLKSLNIPGTFNALNVAIDGNRGLVVGTSGTESSTLDFNAKGVANHLTLTILDISDPKNPQILGSTVVTNEQYPLNEAGAKTDVVDLGNGDFAISDNDANGNPDLLVVNSNDPSNPVVAATQVPSGVHGITVSGDTLYATTSSGLSVYKIGKLVSDPVTITVNLPAGTAANIVSGSYNIPPTQVNTSAKGDSLVWDRNFASGNTTFTFDWQTKLSNVQAGQTIPITTGATATYTTSGTPGTLTLPGTSVNAVPIISLTPLTETVQPGATATYDVRVTNPTDAKVTYNLYEQGAPATATFDTTSVTLAANSSTDVRLQLASEATAAANTYSFTVTAYDNSFNGVQGTAKGSLILAGQAILPPDSDSHGIVATLTPVAATAGQGTSAIYTVQLTNTGSADDTFSLAATGLPAGVTATFRQTTVDVPPGASNFRDVTLTLTPAAGTAAGNDPFTVTATSTSKSSVTTTAKGTLTVVDNGVRVSLDKSTGAPGDTFQMTVTNTGTVKDTFNLSLGGPGSLVAQLGTKQVTLAAGASRTVPITTGPVNFAVQGALNLVAVATSQTSTAVTSEATATLSIPPTIGLGASFSPASQTLPAPGATTFLLQVNNTGNSEDAYTATITGTSGPISASLVGLDGQSAQAVPIFRLPGLSTGAILLQTTATGAGQGKVNIQVHSLTNDNTDSVTATLTALAQPAPGAQPQPPPPPPPSPPSSSKPILVGLSSTFVNPTTLATVALFSNGDLYLIVPGFVGRIFTGIRSANLFNDPQGDIGLLLVFQGSGDAYVLGPSGSMFLGSNLRNVSAAIDAWGYGTIVFTYPNMNTLALTPGGSLVFNLGSVINVFRSSSGLVGGDYIHEPNGMLTHADAEGTAVLGPNVVDATHVYSPFGWSVFDLVLSSGLGQIITPWGTLAI